MGSKERQALIWVVPFFLIVSAITIFPLLYALKLSLYYWNIVGGQPRYIGFQNYTEMLRSTDFYNVLKTSGVYTGLSVFLEFALGLIVALIMKAATDRNLKWLGLIRTIFTIPIVMPLLMVGLMFRVFYFPTFGLIHRVLMIFGLPTQTWLTSPGAIYAIIAVDVWRWTPFMFIILFAGLLAIPREVVEAAEMDGAGYFRKLLFVILPLLNPIIAIALLLRTMDSIKFLDLVYILTGGGPGFSTEILSFHCFRVGFVDFFMGKSAALSYVILIIIAVLSVGLFKLLRKISAV